MNINNVSNFNFKGLYRINGANTGTKINDKYSELIKNNREEIKNKTEQIAKLKSEIKALNDEIIDIHTSRALQIQALQYMANPDIQEKIASLPDDVMVEFSTTSASARAYDKISDQPMLYLYSKDSDGYYIPQKAHIFHTDSSLMLDTKSADKWFDSI